MPISNEKIRKLWEYFKRLEENPFQITYYIEFYNWIRYLYNNYFEPYGVDFDDIDWTAILRPELIKEENERRIEGMFSTGEIYKYVRVQPEIARETAEERVAERFAERVGEILGTEERRRRRERPSEIELRLLQEVSEVKKMVKEIIDILRKGGAGIPRVPELPVEALEEEPVSKFEVLRLMQEIINNLIKLGVIDKKGYLKEILTEVGELVDKNWPFISMLLIKPSREAIGLRVRLKGLENLEKKKRDLLEKTIIDLSTLEEIFSRDYKPYKDIWEIYNTFDQVHKTFIALIKNEIERKLGVRW